MAQEVFVGRGSSFQGDEVVSDKDIWGNRITFDPDYRVRPIADGSTYEPAVKHAAQLAIETGGVVTVATDRSPQLFIIIGSQTEGKTPEEIAANLLAAQQEANRHGSDATRAQFANGVPLKKCVRVPIAREFIYPPNPEF
jgi:hypothetical protein